jgi:predicted nucleic acid-binding protein
VSKGAEGGSLQCRTGTLVRGRSRLVELVEDDAEVPRLSKDPDDDKYIAAAVEGRAALVVGAILTYSVWACTQAFEL